MHRTPVKLNGQTQTQVKLNGQIKWSDTGPASLTPLKRSSPRSSPPPPVAPAAQPARPGTSRVPDANPPNPPGPCPRLHTHPRLHSPVYTPPSPSSTPSPQPRSSDPPLPPSSPASARRHQQQPNPHSAFRMPPTRRMTSDPGEEGGAIQTRVRAKRGVFGGRVRARMTDTRQGASQGRGLGAPARSGRG